MNAELTFGDVLRHRRDLADLTQEDLADRTGLTSQAISLLERGERRRPHRYTVQKLAEALGLEGQDLATFEAAARRPASRVSTIQAHRSNLPAPPTPLVGREHDAAAVEDLLRRGGARLVTVTGPGGVGKTRLAIEVAGRLRGVFADGVVFVPLASVGDPDLFISTLAETLDVTDSAGQSLRDALIQHLRDRRMLLVLDNFEHLLAAVSAVSGLLSDCPGLVALVTSRAPLRLGGERQYPLHPLSLPDSEKPAAAEVLEPSPAVELFLQRARAVLPDFELTPENVAPIAAICRRLDGLPLAIELAAARIKLFPPRVLLERLERGSRVLGAGTRDLPRRQKTLRDTIAWSHELLDPAEQALFGRLAVFSGGCTLEAAEVVCGSGPDRPEEYDVLETLASLVDNSLLVVRSGAPENEEPRFTMLETIREYASERLLSGGEAEEMSRAHARYYLTLAEAAQPEVSRRPEIFEQPEAGVWALLDREHDNLRAALRWAIQSGEVETGTELGLMLWRFWASRSLMSEGRRWLEAVLALGNTAEAEPPLPARRWAFLHLAAGMLAAGQGDYDRAVVLLEESLALYQDLGYRKETSGPLRELGAVAYFRGDYELAVRLSEQSLVISREFGSSFGSALTICNLSDALRVQGALGRAKTLLEESLAKLQGEKYPLRVAYARASTLARLGSIECELGNLDRASELYAESLDVERKFEFRFEMTVSLEGLARVAAAKGRQEQAARILGTSAALREEMGTPLTPVARVDHDHTVNATSSALGEETFAAAWEEGYSTPFEEVIADVLGEER